MDTLAGSVFSGTHLELYFFQYKKNDQVRNQFMQLHTAAENSCTFHCLRCLSSVRKGM